MIASLEGNLIEKDEGRVIIEVAGIGYEVSVPTHTFAKLRQGERVRLCIVHVVKEDAEDLYGFETSEARNLFKKLISISGVGPKTGVQVMSIGTTEEIRRAIDAGDVTRLTSIPGIGGKTAQKIILELRGKLAEQEFEKDGDLLDALVAMGYNRHKAGDALSQTNTKLSEEQRLKETLKRLK